MSSITITTPTYSSTLSSNLPNINIPPMRPAYLSSNPLIRPTPPDYQHLKQQIQNKPSLYGAGQRKYNNLHKFQTGTTTTFNGYTNVTGYRQHQNLTPLPHHRNFPSNNNYNNNHYQNNPYQNQQHYQNNNNNNNNNNNRYIPSLLEINPFHAPSRHNTRSNYHAQLYNPNYQNRQSRSLSRSKYDILSRLPSRTPSPSYHQPSTLPPPIKPRRHYYQNNYNQNDSVNNNNTHGYNYKYNNSVNNMHNKNDNSVNNTHGIKNYNNNNNYYYYKCLILSDSMCSRLRTYAMRKFNLTDVKLSFESGCDVTKMISWLHTPEGKREVSDSNFLLISLGTNDVGRYGVDVSLQRVSDLISFIRQSFPGILAIGWLALSPRWKPTRFVSPVEIRQMHDQFNEHLRVLSKQLDFDVVDARLGPSDMRVEDGLHPSTTTGKWKYEGAIREWFTSRAVAHSSPSLFQQQTTAPNYNNNNNNNIEPSYRHHYNNNNNNINRNVAPTTQQHNNNNRHNTPYISRHNSPYRNNHNNRNNNSPYLYRQNRNNSPYNRHNRIISPYPYRHNYNNNNNYNNRPTPYSRRHYNDNNIFRTNSPYNRHNRYNNRHEQHHINNTNRQVQNTHNSTQPFQVTVDRTVDNTVEKTVIEQSNRNSKHPCLPSRTLIKFYPHKLKTKEQYFRENEPPKEIEKEKEKLFLAANFYYQSRYYEVESKKWKIYEQVASRKEKVFRKDGDDILMEEVIEDEIPQPRSRRRERYSAILDMTISETDSKENENSSNSSSNSQNSSSSSSSSKDESSSSSEVEQEDKKKRKLRDTSISPTSKSKDKTKSVVLRKKKQKSKKKKKMTIENDPRAPEGSPVLLVNENREQIDKIVSSSRPDTPLSPSAKKPRLFSHVVKPPRVAREKNQEIILSDETLPRTPPGLSEHPALSPRHTTPHSPIPPPQQLLISTPIPITSPLQGERNHLGVEEVLRTSTSVNEQQIPMDFEIVSHSPSVVSKDIEKFNIDLFDFPVIPIECVYHFKVFKLNANAENIKTHREFLEQKTKQFDSNLEQLMKQFNEDTHRTVVKYIKDSIEPLIEILEFSNKKRLDNLILDQMREKALRSIKNKGNKVELEQIDKARARFERSLQLKFQLDKLDRRLNENMPPPALNIMDKLQFRSKELGKEMKDQYSEQWNSIIRKAKLELTSVMRLAKVAEIDKSEKEHQELVESIRTEIRQSYIDLVHTIKIRQDSVVQKKLNFLERKAQRTIEK